MTLVLVVVDVWVDLVAALVVIGVSAREGVLAWRVRALPLSHFASGYAGSRLDYGESTGTS